MISSPFKLNLHRNSPFDPNPFKLDKPLPPVRKTDTKVTGSKNIRQPPFKQSSPGKAIGNCKAGTFTPYPEHAVDGFELKSQKPAGPKYGMFSPSAGNKSRPTDSVIRMHVTKIMNLTNFRTVKSQLQLTLNANPFLSRLSMRFQCRVSVPSIMAESAFIIIQYMTKIGIHLATLNLEIN